MAGGQKEEKMSEELKLVRCGCGGEAILQFCESGYSWNRSRGFCVECTKCQIKTIDYQTEAEAVQIWNKAMGVKDINVPGKERTAKVSNQIFNNPNPYTVGAWIGTCECGELVSHTSKYCHMCGAKLDWSGNE